MLSLRQSLTKIGKPPPIRIPRDMLLCESLRDTLIAWNHIPFTLLIIAPQEFVEALGPLAAHKNNTGIPTRVLSLEHIYQAYPGRDEAEKVKRCIALFQPNNNVRYVMLVGDCDKFPVRYTKWWNKISDADPEHSTLYVPVDLYYAALFKKDGSFDDWDGNKNGYFGEVPSELSVNPVNPDNVDVIPELAVGRVLASTVLEVKTYVSKVIRYERGAYGAPWAKTALLVAMVSPNSNQCKYQEYVANCLQGFTVHRLYEDGNPCQATESLNPGTINTYMNQGVGFVSYLGHGGIDGWDGVYLVPNLVGLLNSDKLPIVVVVACGTAMFTVFPPLGTYKDVNGHDHLGTQKNEVFEFTPPQPACFQRLIDYESMAEEMTVKRETGAVAYVGSTLTGGLEDLHQLFFEAVVHPDCKTLGDVWRHVLQKHYQKHIPPVSSAPANTVELIYFIEPWRYGLFGDPSLRVGGIPH